MIKKGMNKYEVNEILLINNIKIELVDTLYMGNNKKHRWKCSCGNFIESRSFSNIKDKDSAKCKICKYKEIEERYKKKVEETKEYEYLRSYRAGEVTPNGIIVKDSPYIQIKHKRCGRVLEVTAGGFIAQNKRCKCSKQENSIAMLYPNISKQIYKDIYGKTIPEKRKLTIHKRSNEKFYYKCTKCGLISDRAITLSAVVENGNYSCKFCSDGISLPEKFMTNLLLQLNIKFEFQKVFTWSKYVKIGSEISLYGEKQYDFYIPNLNLIIEVHGIQHYKQRPKARSLYLEQANDEIKKKVALDNKINQYIVIDCRESTLNWLKDNISKELQKIFNLSIVNWSMTWEHAQNSLVVETWKLYDEIKNIKQVSEQMKLSEVTIKKYLSRGHKIKKCSYDSEKEKEKLKHKIICITTNEIFDSITEASKKYNLTLKALSRCCKSKSKLLGELEGEIPLAWMYLEEYLEAGESYISHLKNIKHKNIRRVICLTTGKIFDTAVKAAEYYGIQRRNLTSCCQKKRNYCGKLDDGTKLEWAYYDEYLNMKDNLYSFKKEKEKICVPVRCITTGKEFDSIKEAELYYGLSRSNIISCCKGKRNYCGKLQDETKLKWEYIIS